MLFDLRGRGRRRTIQAIYLFLAVLIGGGLIFFGVGGTGVGLFNSDDNNGSSGSGSVSSGVKTAEKQVKARPQDPAAWENLARKRFQNAAYDSNNRVFTDQGQLEDISTAYKRYRVLLKRKAADAGILQQMIQIYGESGLRQYPSAVPVAEELAARKPSVGSYEQLSIYATMASQQRKADLATQKATSLAVGAADSAKAKKDAPKAVSSAIKQQVAFLRQIQQQEAQQSSGGSSP